MKGIFACALTSVFSGFVFGVAPPAPAIALSDNRAALEKRIASIEEQIAPLQTELQQLRKKLHELLPVTVVPMRYLDPKQAVEIVGKVYEDAPGAVAEALPRLKCVAVRADEPRTREIKEFLSRLDAAAQTDGHSAFNAPLRLDDAMVVVETIKWLEKRRKAKEKNGS
jgi:hypothetical protein